MELELYRLNLYVMKLIKEIENDSRLKDDIKDLKRIANLVKDRKFGMPYFLKNVYTKLLPVVLVECQVKG